MLDKTERFAQLQTALAEFLYQSLSNQSKDWWNVYVLPNLSKFSQKRLADKHIQSLNGLSLRDLLKVFLGNYENLFNQKASFSDALSIERLIDFVSSREDASNEPIQENLETTLKIAQLIDAPNEYCQSIHKEINPSRFEIGQIVKLKASPQRKGAIINVESVGANTKLRVFIDNTIETFFESQVMLADEKPSMSVSPDRFLGQLTAQQINQPDDTALYSLNSAKIDFIPYQFRPVMKLIRSDRPRLLIADGVGVGKTIEAGLILKELQARQNTESVLIICPRPLLTERKWEREMTRFGERFVQLDGAKVRDCLLEVSKTGEWPEAYKKAILPYSLLSEEFLHGDGKRQKGLLDLSPCPFFDLIIVDEAHHIRNPSTWAHQAVSYLCDHAHAVVFLTATPVQLGNSDLYVLTKALRPDLVLDRQTFDEMTKPNRYINEAVHHIRAKLPNWQSLTYEALEKANVTEWGEKLLAPNPQMIKVLQSLKDQSLNDEQRVQLLKTVEDFHTLSSLINRTRRRDIGQFTVRKPITVTIPFTQEQKKLHDAILKTHRDIYGTIYPNVCTQFMMTTIRRQAASCLHGLVPLLKDILERRYEHLVEAVNGSFETFTNLKTDVQKRFESLLRQAKSIPPEDPKLDALVRIIEAKQTMPNKKVMVFSTFIHTLTYLQDQLSKRGWKVGLINGTTNDDDRLTLRESFQSTEAECLDILLFSEVGCEGLDYQFCDCMVNYDLPWNPMKVEQRIGRIDRNGQESPSVSIYNMITPDTVDADIYERCLMRIGVFNDSIGESEAILGNISKEIQKIAENYELSLEEQRQRLQQLADNEIRLLQEQTELEKNQQYLLGLTIPNKAFDDAVAEADSPWLRPSALKRLINSFLCEIIGRDDCLTENSSGDVLSLSMTEKLRLYEIFKDQKFELKPGLFHKWIESQEKSLNVAFDTKSLNTDQESEFVNVHHPLTKVAAKSFAKDTTLETSLKVNSNIVPPGVYPFGIYRWEFIGLKDSNELVFVSLNNKLNDHLEQLLASSTMSEGCTQLNQNIKHELEVGHDQLWKISHENHVSTVKELIAFKKQSLETSFRNRLQNLKTLHEKADEDKIKRMREAQIASTEFDYQMRLKQLEHKSESVDIYSSPIAFGCLEVIRYEL